MVMRVLGGIGRRGAVVACRQPQRPSGHCGDRDDCNDAGGHASDKESDPFHLRLLS
jgi:hypothetical protein